jgi:carboxypeptidase C (cathepsin A)
MNEYGWNDAATVIWVDQPAGTGFSVDDGSLDKSEAQVGKDLYVFLQRLLKQLPQYAHLSFFVFGESYGGHYVPAVSHAVFENNKNLPQGDIRINLEGFAIGNGLTNTAEQMWSYADMAYASGTAQRVVSEDQYKRMKAVTPACVGFTEACTAVSTHSAEEHPLCGQAREYCQELLEVYSETGRCDYDMRKWANSSDYDFSQMTAWLNLPEVTSQLGTRRAWSANSMGVYKSLSKVDWFRPTSVLIPEMVNSGIRVLIYSGDQDFICNWIGNKRWVLKLDWAGKEGINAASDTPWKVGSRVAGEARNHGPLTYLRVAQAGHMVPMDQPEAALALFKQFTSGLSFV